MASAARHLSSVTSVAPIRAGDAVRTGANRHPFYRVIAIDGDRAWLRDVQHATDHIVPLARCRRI
jgi:hypothetical protein